MRTIKTLDGYEVKIDKMYLCSPWDGIILGNVNRDWVFSTHLANLQASMEPLWGKRSWHHLIDNRTEPPNTYMHSAALWLTSDTLVPDNPDDCFCGSHAFISTIVHCGRTNQSISEAIEARIQELTWEDLAYNWDF